MRLIRTIGIGALCAGLATGAGIAGFLWADSAFPPPLEHTAVVSTEVVDRDSRLLRAFSTPDGRWRLRTRSADVDPQFLKMLIAYEDRRFEEHRGVDPMALGRAAVQLVANGRIISGGSTISMQVARLIEPRRERSIVAKLIQIARAIQIERRLDKAEILDLYLTLAPYGGNLEGVRAASLAYFGKEPRRLSVEEAALLVALPQLPERRRPDRHPQIAEAARHRVLERMQTAGVLAQNEIARAEASAVPTKRQRLPALAAHVAEAARRKAPDTARHVTTLDAAVQRRLETVAVQAAAKLDPKVSLALMMVDATTGEILAEVGAADYFDASRSGWIDMTRQSRSPGSTLKPFIYGLAFEEGLVAQETIVEDRPADFFGYRPKNFDMSYQGDVSIRQALQLSLNVPAVRLLDALGPTKLMARLRRAEVTPRLPTAEAPGLAIALGGVGMSLKDLVQLYAGLANRDTPVRLGDGVRDTPGPIDAPALFEPVVAWNVADILSAVLPPLGSPRSGIAYKTGTSYGYRDAWSVGFDGRYVIGVWIGRPDNAAIPGIAGYATAAPVLFEAFAKSGIAGTPLPPAPRGAARIAQAELPVSQRRFSMQPNGLLSTSTREKPPQIVYPPEGAQVELGSAPDGSILPLVLKLQAGRAPFRWLANGKPLAELTRRRTSNWMPEGSGYSTLTVIDAAGRAASVGIFIRSP
ncbi:MULTISPECIES: penicillin-binding protein 1C [Alphaproteobacteria]|uniref:peptidoglycan glycosyltransferase n=2 Tax=Alphaproteobacteria TaxID=28211 RepID=A0A512HNB7_9HYPH|nr:MULTISPECIES: penicillin-binding protein 1C [Alphaproteobacteria]GEO86931.1 penicillin-binding protein 1C [Ciceribacter naphthalenivorans]GLR22245.1 penicillin-binding protein 1C [Ciceribacter naphthalenivorans]GLT05101.1 penicillin-binding protein 1C [Sphingomonas psychrolutea]